MSSSKQPLHPLVIEGGSNSAIPDLRDPFEVLDDLMHVIEALCPTYPPRDTFTDSAVFKL